MTVSRDTFWHYATPADLSDLPPSGEVWQATTVPATFRFSAVDADGVDRSAGFLAMRAGDVFAIGQQSWVVATVGAGGSFFDLVVAPPVMVSPAPYDPCIVSFVLALDQPPPPRPTADLGPLDSYATLGDLDAALGVTTDDAALSRRSLCLIAATRWVAYRVGAIVIIDRTLDPNSEPFDVNPVPAPPSWRQATAVAAVRFFKGPEVPFGVAGGWDMATYVRQSIPDADLILYGQRAAFGIA